MDVSQIESMLGLASTALTATGKAVGTVEAIKHLFSSSKSPDNAKAEGLVNALATELTAANLMNVQLSEMMKTLVADLRRQSEFEADKARYELVQTPENDYAFRLKEDMANGQPIHFVCPVCLNRDKLFSYMRINGDFMICQTSDQHFVRCGNTPVHQPRRRDSRNIFEDDY